MLCTHPDLMRSSGVGDTDLKAQLVSCVYFGKEHDMKERIGFFFRVRLNGKMVYMSSLLFCSRTEIIHSSFEGKGNRRG